MGGAGSRAILKWVVDGDIRERGWGVNPIYIYRRGVDIYIPGVQRTVAPGVRPLNVHVLLYLSIYLSIYINK